MLAVLSEQVCLKILSLVPVVGPGLASLASSYRGETQVRRIRQFAEELAHRIEALQADKMDRNYAHSERYVEFVLHAAELAASQHRDEKIVLLAEVAAGAARQGTTDLWRDKWLSTAVALSPEHVQLLRALQDHYREGVDPVVQRSRFVVELPQQSEEEHELLCRDLDNLGLIEDAGNTTYGGQSRPYWRVSTVGYKFLNFLVSQPVRG